MGKGIVDELKKEYVINDEWRGFEIHPERPPQGQLMRELFPGRDFAAMYDSLRRQGAPFGLHFADRTIASNSHLALAAGEFAKTAGAFSAYHRGIFRAYFEEGRDIGDLEVVLAVAATAGLDTAALTAALWEGRYEGALAAVQAEAHASGIGSVPTFIINGRERVVGAQPVARFREFLRLMAAEGAAE